MTTVRSRSLADRLGSTTSATRDLESLAQAVFTTVSGYVPFAFACLATTDPASELISRAFKSTPLPIGDEEFAAAEYGAPDINQFAEIAVRPVPVGVLSIDTEGEPARCRRFRDFLAPRFAFTDEVRLVCRARNTTWAALALYRGTDEAPFTRQDAELLAGVHEIIADSVRRTLFSGASSAQAAGGAAVLIVDSADRVTDMTEAVHRQIEDLGGWENGSLPPNVLAVAALARSGTQPATTRVLGRSGRWLALQAMTLDGGPTSQRAVVVTVDVAAQAAVGQLALAARGLTAREQDVAQLVLQGASTRVIAASLHLSPHTVQDHLKAIFRKLGVTSRREMIAQLVLTDADGAVPAPS